jgi:hypothetical protein
MVATWNQSSRVAKYRGVVPYHINRDGKENKEQARKKKSY